MKKKGSGGWEKTKLFSVFLCALCVVSASPACAHSSEAKGASGTPCCELAHRHQKPTHLPCVLLNACMSDHNAFNLEWLGVTLPKCSCASVRSVLGRGEAESERTGRHIYLSLYFVTTNTAFVTLVPLLGHSRVTSLPCVPVQPFPSR